MLWFSSVNEPKWKLINVWLIFQQPFMQSNSIALKVRTNAAILRKKKNRREALAVNFIWSSRRFDQIDVFSPSSLSASAVARAILCNTYDTRFPPLAVICEPHRLVDLKINYILRRTCIRTWTMCTWSPDICTQRYATSTTNSYDTTNQNERLNCF